MTNGRREHRSARYIAYLAGATLGGTILGAFLFALKLALRPLRPAVVVAVVLLALLAVIGPTIVRRLRLSLNRQVPIEWAAWNRPAALHFWWGFLMGLGVITFTATVGWAILLGLALLSPNPVAVGAAFGLGRGIVAVVATGIGKARPFERVPRGFVSTRLDRYVGALGLAVALVATSNLF